MPDMEKVKQGLHQHCECSLFDRCGECPYYEVADEQFSCRDRLLDNALELLKGQPEIVRCKDCKHWERRECGSYGTCEDRDGFFDAYWFCADGERKE